jgi:hypothetical protein
LHTTFQDRELYDQRPRGARFQQATQRKRRAHTSRATRTIRHALLHPKTSGVLRPLGRSTDRRSDFSWLAPFPRATRQPRHAHILRETRLQRLALSQRVTREPRLAHLYRATHRNRLAHLHRATRFLRRAHHSRAPLLGRRAHISRVTHPLAARTSVAEDTAVTARTLHTGNTFAAARTLLSGDT